MIHSEDSFWHCFGDITNTNENVLLLLGLSIHGFLRLKTKENENQHLVLNFAMNL